MNIKFPFWQEVRKLLVDMGDNTYAERVEAYPPKVLMTDQNGIYTRLRVDVGQTGFFAGREFRTFWQFAIPTGQQAAIKIVAGCDTIVQQIALELILASVRFELVVGGTESGTFNNNLPVFKTNQMSTSSTYTSEVFLAYGGAHTGGTLVDVFDAISGSNQNKAVASGVTENLPTGFSAGTYYIRLINTDGATATGIMKLRWEERL